MATVDSAEKKKLDDCRELAVTTLTATSGMDALKGLVTAAIPQELTDFRKVNPDYDEVFKNIEGLRSVFNQAINRDATLNDWCLDVGQKPPAGGVLHIFGRQVIKLLIEVPPYPNVKQQWPRFLQVIAGDFPYEDYQKLFAKIRSTSARSGDTSVILPAQVAAARLEAVREWFKALTMEEKRQSLSEIQEGEEGFKLEFLRHNKVWMDFLVEMHDVAFSQASNIQDVREVLSKMEADAAAAMSCTCPALSYVSHTAEEKFLSLRACHMMAPNFEPLQLCRPKDIQSHLMNLDPISKRLSRKLIKPPPAPRAHSKDAPSKKRSPSQEKSKEAKEEKSSK